MTTTVAAPPEAFTMRYSAARVQYVVWRGEIEIVPTAHFGDPMAFKKAQDLARALNRVYADEAEAERFTFGADEHHFADGSPRPGARDWFEAQRAAAFARLDLDAPLTCDVCGQALPHATLCVDNADIED